MSLERPVEIELKYRVTDPLRGEQLLASGTLGPFRAAGSAPSLQFEDRYVDTADGALARAGFAARLRHSRSLVIVTLKSLGRASGPLQRRTEIEGPASDGADPATWPPSPARSLILELCGDAPLVERVTIRQLRRRRRLIAGTAIVELSLDEVDVLSRTEVVDHFVELEAELLAGDESALDELRQELDADPGLHASPGSKLEAGIEALERHTGASDAWADAVLGRPSRYVPEQGWAVPMGAAQRAASDDAPTQAPPEGVHAAPEAIASEAAEPSGAPDLELMEPAPDEVLADDEALSHPESLAEDEPLAFDAPVPDELDDPAFAERSAAETQLQDADRSGDLSIDLVDIESELAEPAIDPAASFEATDRTARSDIADTTTTPEPPTAPPAAPVEPLPRSPGVQADDPVAEAGRKVLRFHFLRLVAREPGTRSGEDPEDLHAMRVATRRLRSAWRVFGDAYKADERKRQVSQLRDVATRLGAVRDLDVLLIGLRDYRKPLPERERVAIEPLATEWKRRREGARTQLLRELDSEGYQRFLTDLREFVETPGAGTAKTDPTVPHRVRDTAASRVWNAYEQVRAFEPILRWADVPTLHELRIRAKWLRYSMEFIREALGPETPIIIQRVVALQDHLGLMNDADVSVTASRAFLVQRASRLAETEAAAIGRYLVSRERDVARLRQTVATPWRAVASPQFRRALGRAIATL